MIYLITGVPGSGKTLYAVSTLVQRLAAEKIKTKGAADGQRRVIVDGIKGLLIPHEPMAPGTEDDDGNMIAGDGNGVWNWFEWCIPGDVIVIDEVQRWWRPRGMGTKPPKMIKALETHRHMGVDFVIVTQNPMLIDQNVRRLVGRHQNVRRLFGMARAIIYDWDSCSVDITRTKGATSTLWNYPKDAYKLYESSQLHTKQRQKIPPWLIVPILAIVGGIVVAPMAFGTMKGAMTGKGVGSASTASAPVHPASAPVVAVAPVVTASALMASASAPNGTATPPAAPVVAGCIKTPKKCACVDSAGLPATVEPGYCEASIVGNAVPGQKADLAAFPDPPDYTRAAGDPDVLAFMVRQHRATR